MYELLQDIARRPAPFSHYTARELWTRPYLAQQMLSFHLDQDTVLASYRFDIIDQIVNWIDSQLDLSDKRICDLGCGPGLYTQRFLAKGAAAVTGVDFSAHALAYANAIAEQSALPIRYLQADYLTDDLPDGFDIVTLIYTDFCVLSPQQRAIVLHRMRDMLKPGGRIVIDVNGIGSLTAKEECTHIEDRLMGGFWAEGDYVGIQRSFIYPQERLSLDRYLIVEPDQSWQVFNWFQHFTPQTLQAELTSAGFAVEQMRATLTGEPLRANSDVIAVIAS